jgi:hypothetical protein
MGISVLIIICVWPFVYDHFAGSSSLWFILHPSELEEAKRLWKTSKRDFEKENYFALLSTLKESRSKFFVVEQQVGDLVIIPSMACHQVYNKVK